MKGQGHLNLHWFKIDLKVAANITIVWNIVSLKIEIDINFTGKSEKCIRKIE